MRMSVTSPRCRGVAGFFQGHKFIPMSVYERVPGAGFECVICCERCGAISVPIPSPIDRERAEFNRIVGSE
jgi:hypothetical protein